MIKTQSVQPFELRAYTTQLVDILQNCVDGGASVGFIQPFPRAENEAFWQESVFPQVDSGARRLFVATEGKQILGTVQLILGMPANQPHRGEVAKLLVHQSARRKGVAIALMAALEQCALEEHRRLLTLDTRTGDVSQSLYQKLGFQIAGMIPGYCLSTDSKSMDSTTYMYKTLLN
ncbi:MAG: GNAT family N-acetyltransferase [Pseudoruegeria sp.]